MQRIKCLIIDDEQHAIDVLVHHMRFTPFLQLEAVFTNPLEALAVIDDKKIDLVFLDIQMQQLSGMDMATMLRGKCRVVLSSAFSQYAIDGYQLDVLDYLVKPVSPERFIIAAQRAKGIIERSCRVSFDDDYLVVKTELKGKLLKINLPDIDYIEAMKNYVAIYHNERKTLALLTMTELETRLPPAQFIRVHKSFIVPLRKVCGVEGNAIQLISKTHNEIQLGLTYRELFLEKIKNRLLER